MTRAKKSNNLTIAMAKEMDPIIKEIFRLDADGWACGISICGDLFEGSVYDLTHAFWTYDSSVNRTFVETLWCGDTFAKEVY